jgi:antitoxin component YwqK of YwqJK toxin-antitoxin module
MKAVLFNLLGMSLLTCSVFGQKITVIKDSIMNERMKSGYATKHFRPDGAFDSESKRTGFWKDYEVINGISFQESNNQPLKIVGMYLFYGEGKYESGLRQGDWTIYIIQNNTDKKIKSQKLSYSNGQPEGPFTYYYPNGDKAFEGNYNQGKIEGLATSYYSDNRIFGKQNYKSDVLDGEQNYFYPGGKIHVRINYQDGKANGPYQQMYENEQARESFEYLQDSVHGMFRFFYPDGKLWTEKQYENGRLLNVLSIFDKNGKPLEKGDLKDGNGVVYYYDEEGNVYERTMYKDGREVKKQAIRPVKFK